MVPERFGEQRFDPGPVSAIEGAVGIGRELPVGPGQVVAFCSQRACTGPPAGDRKVLQGGMAGVAAGFPHLPAGLNARQGNAAFVHAADHAGDRDREAVAGLGVPVGPAGVITGDRQGLKPAAGHCQGLGGVQRRGLDGKRLPWSCRCNCHGTCHQGGGAAAPLDAAD